MRISGTTRLAGIMGWPVTHSRSPLLHGFWIRETGIDGAYLPLPVEPAHLEQALRALPILGFRGCNLTIPHKRAALSMMDRIEPTARRIGAVNTVIVQPDGSLDGCNTDAFGFRESLREAVPHWNSAAGPAVVLGAGGAARAVVAALERRRGRRDSHGQSNTRPRRDGRARSLDTRNKNHDPFMGGGERYPASCRAPRQRDEPWHGGGTAADARSLVVAAVSAGR